MTEYPRKNKYRHIYMYNETGIYTTPIYSSWEQYYKVVS